ncbi:MAG: glycoside hydrolase domain-containing protein [Actinomycetes bacterium]
MPKVIDTDSHVTSAAITALKLQGVVGVLRYLGVWPSGKGMDKAEADRIRASGLLLAAIYESGTDQMLTGNGTHDADAAKVELAKLGAPANALVWFGCDTEITTAQLPRVMAYLDAASGVLGKACVGVYAGFNVCKAAADRGYKVWQTYAFSGSHNGVWGNTEKRANLLQHNEWGKVWGNLGGLDYDANEAFGDWGAIGVPVAQPKEEPPVANAKRAKYLKVLNGIADNPDRKDEYLWGAEGGSDRDHDGFPELDCSGTGHYARTQAGISDDRTNADGYMHRGKRIDKPSEIGDYGCLLRGDGTAHHIVWYVGGGYVVEAKSSATGIMRSSVSSLNDRGARWFRDEKVNAQLRETATAPATPTAPAPTPDGLRRAKMRQTSQLWNQTLGTKRSPSPQKGGEVFVVLGQDVTSKAGNKFVKVQWGGNSGWVRYDHIVWV